MPKSKVITLISLSLTAMRIHIGQTTHSELLKAGIYHMTKRGNVMIKVVMTCQIF